MIEEISTFEIVEKPVAPVVQEEPETTTTPKETKPNPLVGFLSKGFGVIVLIAGAGIGYYYFIRKKKM